MREDTTITDVEHELAWQRNRALVARVHLAVLSAAATRARAVMKWHILRGRRLVHELRVARGVADPIARAPVNRRRRRTRRVHLRAVRT